MNDRHAKLLERPMPASGSQRLLLYGIRRMAVGGINDAYAAHAYFTAFGLGYRRPLVLLRALMAEMSRVASAKILVAPCCCPRMTAAEGAILGALTSADRVEAHRLLTTTLKVENCLGALTSAEALAQAFHDLGRPLA